MRVVVTGAASGIGRSVCELLVAGRLIPGEHQLLLVDRDAANVQAVAEQLGPLAKPLVGDVTTDDIGDKIVAAALDHMGGIDGLVSNAGIILGGKLAELPLADYDKLFAINTRSNWIIAKAAYPHLKASRGALVVTASISGHQPTPGLSAYSASKAALLMLVKQLAVEWGPDGIRCNTVSPGPTLTPMTAAGYADAARREQREASMPLRKLGTPEEVANAILFLLSEHASHITGIDILVDGGLNNMVMAASGAGTGQTSRG